MYRPRIENDTHMPSESLVRELVDGYFPKLKGLPTGFIRRIQQRAVDRRTGNDRRKIVELVNDIVTGRCYPKEEGFPKKYSPVVHAALESAKEQFPDRAIEGEACEEPIVQVMVNSGFDFASAKDWADAIAFILANNPDVFPKSEKYYVIEGKARRAAELQQAMMQRQAPITGSRPTSPFSPAFSAPQPPQAQPAKRGEKQNWFDDGFDPRGGGPQRRW